MIEALRAFIEAHQAVISLLILVGFLVGFVLERRPAPFIAILGAGTYRALGSI